MASNRRNYYRLLHVQADAPPEVIKASYRALMTVHHPDVGGNHETAALLNEAYAVLSCADRRAAYDIKRAAKAGQQQGAGAPSGRAPDASGARAAGGASARAGCPFCRLQLPAVVHTDSRCLRCRAPLASVRRPGDPARHAERRAMPRVTKSDWGLLHIDWPSEIVDVRMRDVSLDGISVYCGVALPIGRTIRVVGESLDVVGELVSCRRVAKVHTLHARLLTALFASPLGGFVSTSA
jgi:curved DNA-binding protein CbpA